jgi:hypothetical protein
MSTPVRCFHVEQGRPCTRYLEGSNGERAAILERLAVGIEYARKLKRGTSNAANVNYYNGMIDALEMLRDGLKGAGLHEPDPEPTHPIGGAK